MDRMDRGNPTARGSWAWRLLAVALVVSTAVPAAGQPTPGEAVEFVDGAEAELLDLAVRAERAAWVQSTYIIEDTQILAAQAAERFVAAQVAYGIEASRFDPVEVSEEVRRKLDILKSAITLPAPSEAAAREELTRIASGLEATYGSGRWCPEEGECLDLGELSRRMAESRDPEELAALWAGWRTVSVPMREEYRRFVELANRGARELGYADVGAMWRSNYDMDPAAFEAELVRLWEQVRPLYESLHCFVRARLVELYGPEVVNPEGSIPAHLLGNMWAQSWGWLYPELAPEGFDPGYDLTELLQDRGFDAVRMVETGEGFFTSLGFEPLPETFWSRSMFTQPRDRDVVCHASAWDVDEVDDLRIKMCIQVNDEDFATIHHELGHNFYQRAYNRQPYLFRAGANDGFHEGLGDTLALSVTPGYLVELGLLDEEPAPSKDLGLLLRMALDKVAFLPFGLVVDQWRWKVFSGEIGPDEYNQGWWDLRLRYQGVVPPVARSEADFDPGAKYHVPANTPYTRYFLAGLLQFQFHRALCDAGDGPLHRCSIYGDAEAGARLRAMMEMGSSRPWPDALEAVTGERRMDASALLEYFAPLTAWLEERNAGQTCGW